MSEGLNSPNRQSQPRPEPDERRGILETVGALLVSFADAVGGLWEGAMDKSANLLWGTIEFCGKTRGRMGEWIERRFFSPERRARAEQRRERRELFLESLGARLGNIANTLGGWWEAVLDWIASVVWGTGELCVKAFDGVGNWIDRWFFSPERQARVEQRRERRELFLQSLGKRLANIVDTIGSWWEAVLAKSAALLWSGSAGLGKLRDSIGYAVGTRVDRWLFPEDRELLAQERFDKLAELLWGRVTMLVAATAMTALALALGIWFGLPRLHKARAEQFSVQAQLALDGTNYARASFLARSALRLAPRVVAPARVMAAVSDRLNSPRTLEWYQRVAFLEPAGSNQLALARAIVRLQRPPGGVADQALASIPPGERQTADYHMVVADLAILRRDLTNAETNLKKALQLDPKHDRTRLALAALHLKLNKDSNTTAEARLVLERLSSDATLGLAARRILLNNARIRGDAAAASSLSRAIVADPRATFDDHLDHLSVLRHGDSSEFMTSLASVQRLALRQPETVSSMAAWMQGNGLAAEAVDWLQSLPAQLRGRLPVPLTLAECLARLGRWAELETYLQSQNWAHQEFVRHAMLCRALKSQGKTTAFAPEWNRALQLASNRPDQLTRLSGLVNAWGWPRETEETLWLALEKEPRQTWAFEALRERCFRAGNTPGLMRLATFTLNQTPKDVSAQYNFAVLSLLLRTNLVAAHALAQAVYQAKPKQGPNIACYAYSLHMQGRTAAALKLFEPLSSEALEDPTIAACYGILLAAVGDTERSSRYLAKTQEGGLLPEEKALLEEARRTASPPQ